MARVRFLVRVESTINVGCKYGPNDLAPEVWSDLILLAQERQWMDRLVQAFHRQLSETKQAEQAALTSLRADAGVSTGRSLFPGPASKPARRRA